MKQLLCILALFTCFGAIAVAQDESAEAEAPIVLRGILDLGQSQMFSISRMGDERSNWKHIGETFDGYEVSGFDAENKIVILTKGDETLTLSMASSVASDDDPAGPEGMEEASSLVELMRFEEMVNSSMEQQKQAVQDMMRQMAEQHGEEIDEEAIAFQGKIIDEMNKAMQWDTMGEEIAQIYAETFTKSELQGMIDFYNTPSGVAFIDKQPEVQQRTMEVIMPRMMSVMPRIEQMSKEFAAEMSAKEEAEKAEGE